MKTIVDKLNNDSIVSNEIDIVLADVKIEPATTLFKNPLAILPGGMDYAVYTGNEEIGNLKVYGFVSNNFGLISSSEAYEVFMDMFEKERIGNIKVHGKIDIKGNYELRFVRENPVPTLLNERNKRNGDIVEPYIYFSNGLAGTRSTTIGGGVFRKSSNSGMVSQIAKKMFVNSKPVRNTVNSHDKKLGTDLYKILPEILRFYDNFQQITQEQRMLVDSEINDQDVLAYFYALTDGLKFPETKFQAAYDYMKSEMYGSGYTKLNKYLLYVGLNHVLEHDSMGLDLNQIKKIDDSISKRVIKLNKADAIKAFEEVASAEKQRLDDYLEEHGRLPRGKKKILELE